MSTQADFENAPVGATATNEYGLRAMKLNYEGRWAVRSGAMWISDDMERFGYKLDPAPAPTTAREALALAWELAHPVKEGQVIPEGTRYFWQPDRRRGLRPNTTMNEREADEREAKYMRTLDPLPEPEPGWLDAPAVLATCGCRGIELWHPRNEKDGMWVSASGEQVLWSTLRDVTPLYPKGQDGLNPSNSMGIEHERGNQ